MKPLLPGTIVVIRERTDQPNDYPYCFADCMTKYSGKAVTITKVIKNGTFYKSKNYNDDNYEYLIKEDSNYYSWHSSMFYTEGSKISVQGHQGTISCSAYEYYYILFDNNHEKTCRELHTPEFLNLIKIHNGIDPKDTHFPKFEKLIDLINFVKDINSLQQVENSKDDFKVDDIVPLGPFNARVIRDLQRFYLSLSSPTNELHQECCKELEKLVPNYRELSLQFNPRYYLEKDCNIPIFSNITDLYHYYQELLSHLNNYQKIKSHEIKLQNKKGSVTRGDIPEGHQISGRESKASISVGHLSYQVCYF